MRVEFALQSIGQPDFLLDKRCAGMITLSSTIPPYTLQENSKLSNGLYARFASWKTL